MQKERELKDLLVDSLFKKCEALLDKFDLVLVNLADIFVKVLPEVAFVPRGSLKQPIVVMFFALDKFRILPFILIRHILNSQPSVPLYRVSDLIEWDTAFLL